MITLLKNIFKKKSYDDKNIDDCVAFYEGQLLNQIKYERDLHASQKRNNPIIKSAKTHFDFPENCDVIKGGAHHAYNSAPASIQQLIRYSNLHIIFGETPDDFADIASPETLKDQSNYSTSIFCGALLYGMPQYNQSPILTLFNSTNCEFTNTNVDRAARAVSMMIASYIDTLLDTPSMAKEFSECYGRDLLKTTEQKVFENAPNMTEEEVYNEAYARVDRYMEENIMKLPSITQNNFSKCMGLTIYSSSQPNNPELLNLKNMYPNMMRFTEDLLCKLDDATLRAHQKASIGTQKTNTPNPWN